MLTILELWSNEKTDTPSEHALRQLLVSSAWIESILIKNADDINTSFFRKIWKVSLLKAFQSNGLFYPH